MRSEIIASILIASIVGLTAAYIPLSIIDASHSKDASLPDLKPSASQLNRSTIMEDQRALNKSRNFTAITSGDVELYNFILALLLASTTSYMVKRKLPKF